jgi:hypothetical protein
MVDEAERLKMAKGQKSSTLERVPRPPISRPILAVVLVRCPSPMKAAEELNLAARQTVLQGVMIGID